MTPKEKAEELFNKMKGFRVKHSHSKKCAKIAVEELLDVLGGAGVYSFADDKVAEYWNQVKTEIEKL